MSPTGQTLRTGIGAALRAERERRHVSLDAVARGTLVRQDFLELIDADRLEELPTGAYAKGFIRSYVAYLGLDPKPFLHAYEQRCGRPAPELSRVVQRGVRVPPAAQRRAWKIAIGAAGTLIVLLGLLGAFRSGDDPAELPSLSTAAARRAVVPAPNPTGAVVRLEVVKDETWVEAYVDGVKAFASNLARGEYETFKGTDNIELFVARAEDIRITANGKILGSPGEGSYRGVFTPSTIAMPANTPKEPAASTGKKKEPMPSAPPADGTQ